MALSKAEKTRRDRNKRRRDRRRDAREHAVERGREASEPQQLAQLSAVVELLRLDERDMQRVDGVADRLAAAADKFLQRKPSRQQQLHRRVRVAIEDANGVLINTSCFDLAKCDELRINVAAGQLSSTTTAADR